MNAPTPDDALDWDLDERDRLLEAGDLHDEAPAPTEVVVAEDE